MEKNFIQKQLFYEEITNNFNSKIQTKSKIKCNNHSLTLPSAVTNIGELLPLHKDIYNIDPKENRATVSSLWDTKSKISNPFHEFALFVDTSQFNQICGLMIVSYHCVPITFPKVKTVSFMAFSDMHVGEIMIAFYLFSVKTWRTRISSTLSIALKTPFFAMVRMPGSFLNVNGMCLLTRFGFQHTPHLSEEKNGTEYIETCFGPDIEMNMTYQFEQNKNENDFFDDFLSDKLSNPSTTDCVAEDDTDRVSQLILAVLRNLIRFGKDIILNDKFENYQFFNVYRRLYQKIDEELNKYPYLKQDKTVIQFVKEQIGQIEKDKKKPSTIISNSFAYAIETDRMNISNDLSTKIKKRSNRIIEIPHNDRKTSAGGNTSSHHDFVRTRRQRCPRKVKTLKKSSKRHQKKERK